MKNKLTLLMSAILLFTCVSTVLVSAEDEITYGDRGTFEIGLFGSITIPHIKDVDIRSTSLSIGVNLNYFVANGFHVGGILSGSATIIKTSDGEWVDGSEGRLYLLGSLGYAIPVTPKMKIDITGKGGLALMFVTLPIRPIPVFTFGGKAGLLFPVTESAVLGLYYDLTAMTVNDWQYTDGETIFMAASSFLFQFSVYF